MQLHQWFAIIEGMALVFAVPVILLVAIVIGDRWVK